MTEQRTNGTGVVRWTVQLLLPALLAGFGAYVAVALKVAVLEERIQGLRHEMLLANEQNAKEHVRLELKDAELTVSVREVKR